MSAPKLAQQVAIYEHDKNVIVSAGAGSGKTYVLVERFIALLEKNPTWHLYNIVAITFTRKAADEMRDRVRQKLEMRYHQAVADDDLSMADRWASWLSEIDGAQINTIHGLCANLLRANFAEAGLDPQFDVLDEIQSALLLDEAIQITLESIKSQNPPPPELDLFASYGESKVISILRDPSLLIMSRQAIADADTIIPQWVAIQAANFMSLAHKLGIQDMHDDDARWELLMDTLNALQDHQSSHSAKMQALIEFAHINFRKKLSTPTIRTILEALRQSAKQICQGWRELQESLQYDTIAQNIQKLWLNLIRRVKQTYERLKTERTALDFDDLETRTHALLQNPTIVERYRHREIMHLMVDEFQDTNLTQWDIIAALGGGDATNITFLVGDDKQSIYGFRGGDVSVFNRVKASIIRANGINPALTTSFRTGAALIAWFNRFFKQILTINPHMPAIIRDFQVGYGDDMRPNRQSEGDHPPVRLLLIPDRAINDPETTLSPDDRREWEALTIADEIQNIIAQKLPVWDKKMGSYRPVQYSDIAILHRSMTYINHYEEALRKFGVPFITVAGKGYYNRQEVWDLINLLQALNNPYDDLALVSALRSPLFHISDDALLMIRRHADAHRITFWDALTAHTDITDLPSADVARLAKASALIIALRGQIGRRTLGDVLRDAICQTNYLAIISSLPDGDRQRGNVEKLIEKANLAASLSLGEFVAYWRNLNDREAREGDVPLEVGNAVTMMTIHASKGLEYPVVFIPNAQRRERSDSAAVIYETGGTFGCQAIINGQTVDTFGYQWVKLLNTERIKAESLRLLYVATTRAGDYVYISGLVNLKKDKSIGYGGGDGGWLKLIIDELDLNDAVHTMLEKQHHSHTVNDTRISIPQKRPTTASSITRQTNLWETNWQTISPTPLRLLDDVVIEQLAPAKHISAATLADLGSAEHDEIYRDTFIQRFRQQVFHDAPNRIQPIALTSERTRSRQIGEVVHEALRHWHLPSQIDHHHLRAILQNYAWRFGARDDVEMIADRAIHLLKRFEKGVIYETITSAQRVYRELPFVFNWGDYIIHGVIDVLCQTPKGWVIYDYKTSAVPDDNYDEHARRYHLQLAIYAHAVEKYTQIFPSTFIYYIRHNHLVTIPTTILQIELATSLTDRILKMER